MVLQYVKNFVFIPGHDYILDPDILEMQKILKSTETIPIIVFSDEQLLKTQECFRICCNSNSLNLRVYITGVEVKNIKPAIRNNIASFRYTN